MRPRQFHYRMSESTVCGEVLGTGTKWHGHSTYRCVGCGRVWTGELPRSEVMLLREMKAWQEAQDLQRRRERDNRLLAEGLIDKEAKDRLEYLRSVGSSHSAMHG
jgi:hypothetical protein